MMRRVSRAGRDKKLWTADLKRRRGHRGGRRESAQKTGKNLGNSIDFP